MKNEMEYADMLSILDHVHTYVPVQSNSIMNSFSNPVTGEPVFVNQQSVHPVLFGGDQLTVCRARGAQDIRRNGRDATQKLEGLIPVSEDWHTKVCLLQVSILIFNFIWHSLVSPIYR